MKMKCHYTKDEQGRRVLIAGCMPVVVSYDISRCTCKEAPQQVELPLEFVKWYSGMSEKKILQAYERYKKEQG
jgi:hypothetical protein